MLKLRKYNMYKLSLQVTTGRLCHGIVWTYTGTKYKMSSRTQFLHGSTFPRFVCIDCNYFTGCWEWFHACQCESLFGLIHTFRLVHYLLPQPLAIHVYISHKSLMTVHFDDHISRIWVVRAMGLYRLHVFWWAPMSRYGRTCSDERDFFRTVSGSTTCIYAYCMKLRTFNSSSGKHLSP
jgi:hypothetical protein